MVDITSLRAGDEAPAVRRRGRRLETYSMVLGGGLVANVADGRLASFGLEPIGPLVPRLVPARHPAPRRVWAVAAPLAGTVAAGAAVATGFVLRHHRRAA